MANSPLRQNMHILLNMKFQQLLVVIGVIDFIYPLGLKQLIPRSPCRAKVVCMGEKYEDLVDLYFMQGNLQEKKSKIKVQY